MANYLSGGGCGAAICNWLNFSYGIVVFDYNHYGIEIIAGILFTLFDVVTFMVGIIIKNKRLVYYTWLIIGIKMGIITVFTVVLVTIIIFIRSYIAIWTIKNVVETVTSNVFRLVKFELPKTNVCLPAALVHFFNRDLFRIFLQFVIQMW